MPSLKNPQLSIPGGFTFLQPETGFKPTPFSSLDSIVTQLIQHRQGQPYLVAKNGWPMDRENVLAEVTAYNVAVCQRNGWQDYLIGGAETVPFSHPTPRSLRERAGAVLAGARTIVSWIEDGAPTVPQELANHRAEICVACPLNGQGGLESYFTVPATNAIRAKLEQKRTMKLETPLDDKLGVCEACTCPLKLKCFLPISSILPKMDGDTKARLHPACWIISESKAL